MINGNIPIPTFKKADGKSLFLASSRGLKTYADLHKFRDFFIQFLIDYDYDFKKPVGFIADSSDELILALASCWELGIPFICFNSKATPTEFQQHSQAIETGILFTDEKHRSYADPKSQIAIEQLSVDRALSVEVNLSTSALQFTPAIRPEDIFGYFFTSGSTAAPKIVPLKRRQVYFAAEASAQNFKPRPGFFWLLCLPLNHIGGVSVILRSILYGSAVFRMNQFDTQMVSTFLSENPMFQAASLVPTMLKRLMEVPNFRTHSAFKAILLGGGAMDPGLLKRAAERGIPVVASYGMTETCAQIAANAPLQPSGVYVPFQSVGTIFPPNEVEIRDEKMKKTGANNSGTIWLRGPQVFDGYLDEQSPAVFDENGWFNTGDYGHLNANRHLFVEARRSDLIVTGGENVSPYEIEAELEKMDPILEAVVLGLDDEEWGQKVVAVVVSKTEEKIEPAAIQNILKERITPYKIPKEIIQTEALPKTHTGKVKRTELVKLFKQH